MKLTSAKKNHREMMSENYTVEFGLSSSFIAISKQIRYFDFKIPAMEKIAVSIPTAIGAVSVEIPSDYPIHPIGGDFYYNFESVVTDLEEWEAVNSQLENDVLTVEKEESGTVFLREGTHPKLSDVDLDDFLPALQLYWEQNPWTSPPVSDVLLLLSGCQCRRARLHTLLDRQTNLRALTLTYPRR